MSQHPAASPLAHAAAARRGAAAPTRRRAPALTAWAGLVLLALLALACGPPPEGATPGVDGGGGAIADDDVNVMMETQVVYELDGETQMGSFAEVFEAASAALDAEDHEACARLYDAVWRTVTVELNAPWTNRYYVAGVYNAGLCYERLEDWDTAAARYEQLIAEVYETDDGLDATLRLAEVNASRGHWDAVASHMRRMLTERDDLKHLNQVEGMYRLGMAQIALSAYTEAEDNFKTCLRTNRLAGPASMPDRHYLIAGCHYGKALVFHMLFGEVRFKLPEEQMKRDMELKKQLAHSATDQYVRTIRTQNHYWALLSGYMIGKLHEDFYYDLIGAEVPVAQLDAFGLRGYFDELRAQLLPLIDEAIKVYQKTTATGERLGYDNFWADAAADRMMALRAYHDDTERWREEEDGLIELYERRRAGEITDEDLEARRYELEPFARPKPAAPTMAEPEEGEGSAETSSGVAAGDS